MNKLRMNKRVLTPVKEFKKECIFCGSNDICAARIGDIYRLGGVEAHYFCVLLCSDLPQDGRDHEGILGFLIADIKKRAMAAKTQICSYCKKPGATIECSERKCHVIFHLTCGLKRGSFHLFVDPFPSFCNLHRRTQEVDERHHQRSATCIVCHDTLKGVPGEKAIFLSCHQAGDRWTHRKCIEMLAYNAGLHHFKCPLCGDKEIFKEEIENCGIFIQDKDAEWERDDAFRDLLVRPYECSSKNCRCPHGRNHHQIGTPWEVILCRNCGSLGVHRSCKLVHKWYCEDCREVVARHSSPSNRDYVLSTTAEGTSHRSGSASQPGPSGLTNNSTPTVTSSMRIDTGDGTSVTVVTSVYRRVTDGASDRSIIISSDDESDGDGDVEYLGSSRVTEQEQTQARSETQLQAKSNGNNTAQNGPLLNGMVIDLCDGDESEEEKPEPTMRIVDVNSIRAISLLETANRRHAPADHHQMAYDDDDDVVFLNADEIVAEPMVHQPANQVDSNSDDDLEIIELD